MEARQVLVIPEGGLYLAFRLVRILRQAGFGVDLLCVRGDPLRHSRYVDRSIEEESWDSLFERLTGILRQPDRRWCSVIVAREDLARRLMGTNDAALLKNWQPGALDPSARDFFLSKFGLEAAQQRWGLPVPPSRVCHAAEEILAFGERAGWPLISKPPDGSGGHEVLKYDSAEAVKSSISQVRFPLLAQKYIAGRRGVVDMVCSQGRVLAWLASYSTKRRLGPFGPSTARLFQAIPALQPLVEQVAGLTRFEGFCGFDWLEEDGTGRHYLIEFHPRPPSGFRFGRFCGVDFSAAVSAWLNGNAESFTPLVQPNGKAVAANYFTADLTRCLRERDWPGLKSWCPGSGACHDVFWDDLPLFVGWAATRLRERCRGKHSTGAI